jgi:hypothetical protein
MKKYYIAIVGVLGLFLSLGNSHSLAKTTFKDVNDQFWAQAQINYLSEKRIIGGYPDGTFKPNSSLTRGQAAKMLVKALKLSTENRPAPAFKDITKKHDAYKGIATIADEGLMSGTKGYFRPDDTLTRAQMAAILTKAFEMKEGSTYTIFKDVTKKHWAFEQVQHISSNRITGGYSDGTFRPNQPTTRAQFSVFLAVTLYPELFQTKEFDKVTREANVNVTNYGSWIYYNGGSLHDKGNGLFREKIDGNQKQQLLEDSTGLFEIENNQIYYLCNNGLCQMDLNGDNKTRMDLPITQENLEQYVEQEEAPYLGNYPPLFQIQGKWLYLVKHTNPKNEFSPGLYRINLETMETTLLSKGYITSYVVTEQGVYLHGDYDDNEFYSIESNSVETINLWDVTSVTKDIADDDKKNYVFEMGKVFSDRGNLYYTVKAYKPDGKYTSNPKWSFYFIKYNEETKKMTLLRNDNIIPFNIYNGYLYMEADSKIVRTPLTGGPKEFVADIPRYEVSTCWNYPFITAKYSIIGGQVYFYEPPWGDDLCNSY